MDSEIESAMVEQEEISDPRTESFSDRISDKIRSGDARSSSSDSEPDYKQTTPESSVKEEVKEEIHRLLSREKPVHKVFGGGTPADVFLWRNNKVSASVLGGATTVWVLFELLEYHLLTLVCHIAILVLSLSFFWSNASVLINKKPPNFPEVRLPPEPFQEVASALLSEINHAFAVLKQISSGRDLKKFLWVVAGFWFISILGSCCSFLTLLYILFVLLHTVPVLYEKYDDKIDAYARKAIDGFQKQYDVFNHKFLSSGQLDKKQV